MTNLSKLAPGKRAIVLTVGAAGPLRRRLMDMGILVGSEVAVEKVAPLGDPMEIRIRSYFLSLRKLEADQIVVEELS